MGDLNTTGKESFLVAGGASQEGAPAKLGSGRNTFQGVADGSSGAFAATISIMVSNDKVNWIEMGTITLSGTAGTADTDGFASDADWNWARADVASFSGTGAICDVSMGG